LMLHSASCLIQLIARYESCSLRMILMEQPVYSMYIFSHSQRILYICPLLSDKETGDFPWSGAKMPIAFFTRFYSTQMMGLGWLEEVHEGYCVLTCSWGVTSQETCFILLTFSWNISIWSNSVWSQNEEHSLLVCWVVMWLIIQTETNVSHYSVHYMVQGVILSSVSSDVEERIWSGCSGACYLDCPRSAVLLIYMARSWTFCQHVQSLPWRS
jgi:hypothetical protein